jgi:hypothetical protein
MKIDDKVVCIDNTGGLGLWKNNDITPNKTYLVESIFQKGDLIFINNDKGEKEWYNSKLFITLVEFREKRLEDLGI